MFVLFSDSCYQGPNYESGDHIADKTWRVSAQDDVFSAKDPWSFDIGKGAQGDLNNLSLFGLRLMMVADFAATSGDNFTDELLG